MSWVFFFALPLGGFLATQYGIPKTILTVGIGGAVIVGTAIPYTDFPFITFALFGILYAAAAPVLGAMPAQILRPEHRAPGMGIYYVWYFLGSALLPAVGGYLNDITGTAKAPVLFAIGMMLATLILAFVVYGVQRALPDDAVTDR
jgi:MFS family permease